MLPHTPQRTCTDTQSNTHTHTPDEELKAISFQKPLSHIRTKGHPCMQPVSHPPVPQANKRQRRSAHTITIARRAAVVEREEEGAKEETLERKAEGRPTPRLLGISPWLGPGSLQSISVIGPSSGTHTHTHTHTQTHTNTHTHTHTHTHTNTHKHKHTQIHTHTNTHTHTHTHMRDKCRERGRQRGSAKMQDASP
jgi:hypothetical protein